MKHPQSRVGLVRFLGVGSPMNLNDLFVRLVIRTLSQARRKPPTVSVCCFLSQ
jgi:hypothetical protein